MAWRSLFFRELFESLATGTTLIEAFDGKARRPRQVALFPSGRQPPQRLPKTVLPVQVDLSRMELRLGAAKKEAGRAWWLVHIEVPNPGEPVNATTFHYRLKRDKLRQVRSGGASSLSDFWMPRCQVARRRIGLGAGSPPDCQRPVIARTGTSRPCSSTSAVPGPPG